MKLKDQVCDFKIAKMYKDFGTPQKSLFYWVEEDGKSPQLALFLEKENQFLLEKENFQYFDKYFIHSYSAFTMAELRTLEYNIDK